MYNDYEGTLDFTLAIKGAIAIVVIWFLVAVFGNYIKDISEKIRSKKGKR